MSDPARAIRLVLSDVDGTLVTPQKALTPATVAAVGRLRAAGILFTIASSRPPRGLLHLVAPLGLDQPIAGFNGGQVCRPDLTILDQRLLRPDIARRAVELLLARGVLPWVFSGTDWLVLDRDGPYVARERTTVQFEPIPVPSFDGVFDRAAKIVGASADFALLAACEAELRRELGAAASATRSQPYYLDITDAAANKGGFVHDLSRRLGVPRGQIATIGDMANDVLMFAESGLSIAMGNASDAVKAAARQVTRRNDEDGFAHAIDSLILNRV